MAEWSIAAVLKTVELQGSGGSNPPFSAYLSNYLAIGGVFYIYAGLMHAYSPVIKRKNGMRSFRLLLWFKFFPLGITAGYPPITRSIITYACIKSGNKTKK